MKLTYVIVGILLCTLLPVYQTASYNKKSAKKTEQEISDHLKNEYENEASLSCNQLVIADWDVSTDLGNVTKEEALDAAVLADAAFQKEQWEQWFKDADYENFEDPLVQRQTMFLSKLGTAALDEATLTEYNNELQEMTSIYGRGRICPFDNQNCDLANDDESLVLEPEIETVMAKSRNYAELQWTWEQWREKTGKLMRGNYKNYVTLSNEAAQANGYADMGEMWRADYETENFQADIERLWDEVKPLYSRLHNYVKKKLAKVYPDDMPSGNYIPAHILGNMWAQSWENIWDIVVPYPDATPIDITANMIAQGYDVPRMFSVSNEFYTSMGLLDMSTSYDDQAIIEQPEGRDIVCHASAWDFCDGEDFRVKMCTNVDEEDFITVHHELGHIQYFMQYKDQPITFRKGANPGFHEAIGDVIALSVSTPKHYVEIGLLDEYGDNKENDINALMKLALSKVAFLPFAMVIDSWRWEVFSGATPEEKWNQRWWELRQKYQLLDAPTVRGEEYFDPGAKYHVPGNSQYVNYFVAHILQFQMHRALCIAAQEFDPENPNEKPLYKCDIYRSTAAGMKLRDALRSGGSIHWSQVLQEMTGETALTGKALRDYFEPLYEFLEEPAGPVDQTIPIVVGAVLGVVVVGVLTAYFVKRHRDGKKEGETA